jgi:hypothetical protein
MMGRIRVMMVASGVVGARQEKSGRTEQSEGCRSAEPPQRQGERCGGEHVPLSRKVAAQAAHVLFVV